MEKNITNETNSNVSENLEQTKLTSKVPLEGGFRGAGFEKVSIAICSDHAGYELKNKIIAYLKSKNTVEIKDFGAFSTESSDYPDFAHPMANAVSRGEYEMGISCCGTGNGINITANRHAFVRSALCWTPEIAKLARQHNDANVLSLPARFISEELAFEMIDIFFSTDFEGGRHQRRIDKIEKF